MVITLVWVLNRNCGADTWIGSKWMSLAILVMGGFCDGYINMMFLAYFSKLRLRMDSDDDRKDVKKDIAFVMVCANVLGMLAGQVMLQLFFE